MQCIQPLSFALFPAFPFPSYASMVHFHSVEMTAASLPSPTIALQIVRKPRAQPPLTIAATLKPNRWQWQQNPPRKGALLRLKRRETSLKTLHARPSDEPEEPYTQSHTLSPLEALVHDFYSSLNEKKPDRLHQLLDDDCIFEDMAFPKPFKGKQAVHGFLKELTKAMGNNVRFIIDKVYEGKESSIGVRWHLEWKQRHIPLATGCSFYHFSINRAGLHIKKAWVYVESPLKPGAFALELLKIITTLFDKFPRLATWFLEKPHAVVQLITKAYKFFVEPFILPFLMYYTHLWTYAVKILSFVLNLLQNLLKILIK